jgi:type IV secretory pathway VirB10-like protein
MAKQPQLPIDRDGNPLEKPRTPPPPPPLPYETAAEYEQRTGQFVRRERPLQMDLRDQFAMAALPSLLDEVTVRKPDEVAVCAYRLADAMLAERAKNCS